MDSNDPLIESVTARPAHGSFVVLRQPFSDQSDADQSGADADRAASAEDQAASTADDMAAREDQDASDRDQAAADSQQDAARNLTPGDERAYETSRVERAAASVGRQDRGITREQSARQRHATAGLRDLISRPRMRSSAIRKQLIIEGVTSDMAVRWCDAWEIVADRQGITRDADYWNRGTQWIWTERAAGRKP